MNTNIPMMGRLPELSGSMEGDFKFGQTLRDLVIGRKAEQMRQLKTPEEQQAYANNSFFSPYLNQTLRADKAAAAKAAADQLKFDADLNKTYAETYKLGSESGKIGAETGKINTETGITRQNNIGSIWLAFLTGGPNAAKAQLENMKNSGVISPESYQAELDALTNMPTNAAEAQQYALGRFKGLQDPKYSLTTADNVLDNQTSVDNNVRDNNTSTNNNIRTTQASIYSTDKDYQLGQQKLTFDQQQALIKERKGEVKEFADGAYIVFPDGTAEPLRDQQGNHIKSKPRAGKGMSATAQKELFETEDVISASNSSITNLKQALELSKDSYDGVGAIQMAKVSGNLPSMVNTEKNRKQAENTVLLDNLIMGGALDSLKATFGGSPTEGERAILVQVQGSVNLPKAQREAIWRNAIAAAERRLKTNQQKAASIRNGSFFGEEGAQQDPSSNLGFMP